MKIESALVSDPAVAEAAVVGTSHAIKARRWLSSPSSDLAVTRQVIHPGVFKEFTR
jgi:hypothetical protein